MLKGTSKVIQNGMDGILEITTKVVIEDGKIVSTKKVGEAIKEGR
ncbi:G5 domain-containing protein [Caloramator sp. Dgby_cultured_2]